MTSEEVKARAEEVVYVRCTLGDIICRCELLDIPTRTPKGKLRSRTVLEKLLIDTYIKMYADE